MRTQAHDISEVLNQLESNKGIFPRSALERAIELGSSISGELIAVLDRVRAEPDAVPANFMQHIFALYLLAQFRESRAYDAVVKMFSLPEETVDVLTGSVVTESLGQIVASVAHGRDEPMRAMIEREDLGQYVRGAMLRGMACSHVQGELSRERFFGYLSELFNGRIPRQHSALWGEMISTTMAFHFVDLLPEVERAFDDGLIDECMISRGAAVGELSGLTAPRRSTTSRRYTLILDTIAELEWWACFRRDAQSVAPRIVMATPAGPAKVGRNDPCPCGSGRKHKKCCLLASGEAGA